MFSPDKSAGCSSEKTLVFFGLGSNVGDRLKYLKRSIAMLGLLDCKVSAVYKSYPLDSPYCSTKIGGLYFNMVVCGYLPANISPFYMLHYVKSIEQYMGREDTERWNERVLDIDILLWGNSVINSKILKIPHPEIRNRDFVLLPLMEIKEGFYLGQEYYSVKEMIRNTSIRYSTKAIKILQC